MNIASLHLHTTASDGEFTHEKALTIAKKFGIKVVSFTDHDAVPNIKTVDLLRNDKDNPTQWIMGVEIS